MNIEKSGVLAFFLCVFGSSFLNLASAQATPALADKSGKQTVSANRETAKYLLIKEVSKRLLETSVSVPRDFLDKNIHSSTLAIQSNPQDAQAYMIRGLAYWRLEDSARASVDLEKAMALAPAFATPGALRILAECFAEENKNEKAIQALTRAINAGGATSLMYLRRAQAYSQAKNYAAALQDAEKVVAMNPRQRWALELRAHLSMSAGKYENAVRDLSECIKLSPQEGKLYADRANAYDAMGKKAQAKADRDKRDSLNWNLGY